MALSKHVLVVLCSFRVLPQVTFHPLPRRTSTRALSTTSASSPLSIAEQHPLGTLRTLVRRVEKADKVRGRVALCSRESKGGELEGDGRR